MTRTDQLILALGRLERRTRRYVETATLTVEVFRVFPDTWALRHFPEYPDNNKVMATLCHKGGPIRRGLMRRPLPGISLLELTPLGKTMAKQLEEQLNGEKLDGST